MTRHSRFTQWYHTLTEYDREDVTRVAGILLMHKFFFGLGIVYAVLFRPALLIGDESWSVEAVLHGAPGVAESLLYMALAGFAALPLLVMWRYWVYPRAKRYPLGDFLSQLVVLFLSLLTLILGLFVWDQLLGNGNTTVGHVDRAWMVDFLRFWVEVALVLFVAVVLTTLWERYLDGRLSLDSRGKRVGAVLGLCVLLATPVAFGAIAEPESGESVEDWESNSSADATDAASVDYSPPSLSNKTRYDDGDLGPFILLDEDYTAAGPPAPIFVDNATVERPPDRGLNYSVATTEYNASAFTAHHIRVTDRNGTTITAPSHYNVTVDAAGTVIRRDDYRRRTAETNDSVADWLHHHLEMEQTHSMYLAADVVDSEGRINRYVVKVVNPRHATVDAEALVAD